MFIPALIRCISHAICWLVLHTLMDHSPSASAPAARRETSSFKWSDGNVDLVIRPPSGRCYKVEKSFLISASPFFRILFADSVPEETMDDLPVYDVPEDTRTAFWILRLCYPFDLKQPLSCDGLAKCADALRKYMMEGAMRRLEHQMIESSAVEKEPMRAFAIARHYGWTKLSKAAMKEFAQQAADTAPAPAELGRIPALDYIRLKQIQDEYQGAALGVLIFIRGSYSNARNEQLGLFMPKSIKGLPCLSRKANCPECFQRMDRLVVYVNDDGNPVPVGYIHPWVVTLIRGAREKVQKSGNLRTIVDDDLKMAVITMVAQGSCKTQTVASASGKTQIVRRAVPILRRPTRPTET